MVSQSQEINLHYIFSGARLRNWIFILLLALVCRIGFLFFSDQLPVFWDARLYVSASLGLLGSIDSDQPFAEGDGGQAAYWDTYKKFLEGEDIEWLYYSSPTMAEAQKYIFYSGPVYPMLMAAVFAFPLPNDFMAVRLLNSLLDSLAIVFISIIAFIIWRNLIAAQICALLQILYLPLMITCGILGLETITSFFLSLLLLLIGLFYVSEKKWLIIAAGAVGGLLFLTKPTATLISGPVFLFLAYAYFRQWKFLLKSIGLYLIPFFLLIIPWVIFTSSYYGELAIRDPEYSTANFRSSSAIEFEGYDLDFSDADFWTYPVFKRIAEDPAGYANLISKKLVRLWWTPHDEFWQGPRLFETIYHRLLVILALVGIALIPLYRNRLLILMMLIILYYTGIHVILHSVARYNFNALPAMFLFSTAAVFYLTGKGRKLQKYKGRILTVSALLIVLLIINNDSIAPLFLSVSGIYIPMLLTISGILFIAVGTKNIVGLVYSKKRENLYLWIPIAVLCMTTITAWSRPYLKEWSYTITDANTQVGTTISLPQHFRMTPQDEIYLLLDLTTTTISDLPIRVNINGIEYSFEDGKPPADKQFYIKGSYNAFETYMGCDKREIRWYRKLRLKPESIAAVLGPDPQLNITVSAARQLSDGEAITMYGCDIPDDGRLYIPSLEHTSVERFKEFGDRRIYDEYILSSDGNLSFINSQGKTITDDLSDLPGIQTGRWGIVLFIKRPDYSKACY
ncbi:MAG: hypothetical protein R3F48_09805 [Candidatus Zixiibacteriota bacterium]